MAFRKMTSLLASAAALALLAAGTSPAAAQGKEITFATWGGAFGKAFEKVWTKPFEDETGIKVKMIFGGSLSNKQKVIAEAANPQIDGCVGATPARIREIPTGDVIWRDVEAPHLRARLIDKDVYRDLLKHFCMAYP